MPLVVKALGGSFLEIRLLNWVDSNIEENSVYDVPRLTAVRNTMDKTCQDLGIKLIMPLPNESDCNGCTTFTELYVDYRGNISPCYFLNRTPIGNLIGESFESIWNGDNIRKYRENYQTGTVALECCCGRGLIINKRVS